MCCVANECAATLPIVIRRGQVRLTPICRALYNDLMAFAKQKDIDTAMPNSEAHTFEQLVVSALDELPAEFATHLQNIEISIAPSPDLAQRQAVGIKPWQTLYGLYEGVPLTERTSGMILLPDRITLFQEPLERDFPHPAELRAQVRRTVLHEIAHFFGISDERLRELGAY